MELPTILDPILRHLILTTKDYVEKVRHVPVEFYLSVDGSGLFSAKFDYGRESTGSLVQAICGAIANALEPLSQQSSKNLKG